MTINFYLRYHTDFGQTIFISGNNQYFGDNDSSKAIQLSYFNIDFWHLSMQLPEDFDDVLTYKYILREKNGVEIFDGEESRFVDFSIKKSASYSIFDIWNSAGNIGNIFFTRAFSKILLPPVARIKTHSPEKYSHEFRVKAPLLLPGETVCMCGSTQNLRNWNTKEPILLTPKNNWLATRILLEENEWPATYKYGIYNLDKKEFIRFEDGENRFLQKIEIENGLTILNDGFVNYPVRLWKGAGVSIPVFGLRSQKSFGVGEFSDIKLLIDWAKQTGLKLIQLLPINDTIAQHNWRDSYPYAAISAFALHPLYINLEKVAGKQFSSIVKPLRKKQKQLNDLANFDYEQVMKFKLSVLKELFDAGKKEFKNDLNYFEFFDLNRHWLVPYAAFSFLRDKNKTSDFTQWKNHKIYEESAVQKLASPSQPHYDEIAFFYFVQYHLHLQMKEVSDYAHRQKIVLKGDIPIGIYRNGCDAWENPSLYNMDEQAGAPPDDFAVKGQNWGFPTYNWERMKEDNFKWWRKRFDQMSIYFDAFRIDHILGFFRIWSIPMDAVEGILGRFVPAIPVDISEFHSNNIWFDHDRYCKPFITDETIKQIFNGAAKMIKDEFLDEISIGQYSLKEFVNTQAKVEKFFEKNDDEKIKKGLFDLISNVILLEEENSNGQKFHFRISMEKTSSFSYLEYNTQLQLKELYINYFYRRQDDFWKQEAMKKLPELKRTTNMLICGEDLGMVPACVPQVMSDLGILGLEVERMPKNSNSPFFHPKDAPYLSVVTPSTHDMSTIRGWWEEDRGKTQQFYNYILGHYGEAPYFCEPWIDKEIILQHLYSPAMWSIFQLSDLLGMDEKVRRKNPHEERINIPSDPDNYWNYRMHLNLENLLKENEFNEGIKKYVQETGRLGI
ncbi:MAG: 4-alpha-glucanotransferase [Bacteroidota bacterium]|nr:4-alpha-glucanotransferase [Bacteroidota bacterium]